MIEIMPHDFLTAISHLPHRVRQFAEGVQLFERDDPVRSLFGVLSGEVHLLRRHIDGTGVILQRAAGGAILAEASLAFEVYHCAAVTVAPSRLAVFERAAVRDLVESDRGVASALTAHLAREVRNARMKVEILSLKKVADRLDAWLVWHDGVFPARGDWRQVAEEIGVSAEALYRELARRR